MAVRNPDVARCQTPKHCEQAIFVPKIRASKASPYPLGNSQPMHFVIYPVICGIDGQQGCAPIFLLKNMDNRVGRSERSRKVLAKLSDEYSDNFPTIYYLSVFAIAGHRFEQFGGEYSTELPKSRCEKDCTSDAASHEECDAASLPCQRSTLEQKIEAAKLHIFYLLPS